MGGFLPEGEPGKDLVGGVVSLRLRACTTKILLTRMFNELFHFFPLTWVFGWFACLLVCSRLSSLLFLCLSSGFRITIVHFLHLIVHFCISLSAFVSSFLPFVSQFHLTFITYAPYACHLSTYVIIMIFKHSLASNSFVFVPYIHLIHAHSIVHMYFYHFLISLSSYHIPIPYCNCIWINLCDRSTPFEVRLKGCARGSWNANCRAWLGHASEKDIIKLSSSFRKYWSKDLLLDTTTNGQRAILNTTAAMLEGIQKALHP